MDVHPVADARGVQDRREGGAGAAASGHGADHLAQDRGLVRRAQGGAGGHRDLRLPGAVFGHEGVGLEPRGLQRGP